MDRCGSKHLTAAARGLRPSVAARISNTSAGDAVSPGAGDVQPEGRQLMLGDSFEEIGLVWVTRRCQLRGVIG